MMFADPVVDGSFFGREENLILMKKRIDGLKGGYRQNMAVLGQELLGKTSLLLSLLEELETDKELLPVYMLVRAEPLGEFAERFIGVILFHYSKAKGEKESESTIQITAKTEEELPKTVEAIRRIRKSIGKRSKDQILSSVFDILQTISEETNKICVIMLDEFQELASTGAKNAFAALGQKIMAQKKTMYILASSRRKRASKILNDDLSLLFGSFEIENLASFRFDERMAFIRKKLYGFRLSRTATRFLASVSNGNPFYLDTVTRYIKDIMVTRNLKGAEQSVFAEGISGALSSPRGIIYQYMNRLVEGGSERRSPQEIDILCAIARGSRSSREISKSISASTKTTTSRLENLVNSDLIMKCGNVYEFCDSFLKWWVRSVYARRKERNFPFVEGKLEFEFQNEVEKMISAYRTAQELGIEERLRDCLGSFRNDVVTVAGKTLKLPKFKKVRVFSYKGGSLPAVGSTRRGLWVADFADKALTDEGVKDFQGKASAMKGKVIHKILVCLAGIGADAKLLAKEDGIWLWEIEDLNFLFEVYGKPKVCML